MSKHVVPRRNFLGLSAGALGGLGLSASSARGQQAAVEFRCTPKPLPAYDVVVCGGGPAGFAAALAARQEGARVLLVEGQGQLGGAGVSGLVSHWLGGRLANCQDWVVGGIFKELSEEAAAKGYALIPVPEKGARYQPHGWHMGQLAAGIPFDPFAMAYFLDEKIQAEGVDCLLTSQVVGVALEDKQIQQVVIFNKGGFFYAPAKLFIDATGDGDIAARSGCLVQEGREGDGLMTPATLQLHVDQVDQDALSEYIHQHQSPRFRERIKALRAAGEWPFPYDIFISVQLQEKGVMMINTSRLVGIDGTDGASITEGMMRGRKESQELIRIMRKHFPGFAKARIKAVAPALGVRETRRIQGPYQLSVEDLTTGVEFPDTIGFSSYGWDLPDPKQPSLQPMHEKKVRIKRDLTPMPYRILLPQPVENLICAGRCVSVEREVLGPVRVMAPCMAMGEAAGTAAGLALNANSPFAQVDTIALRKRLKARGAIVDWKG